MTPSTRTDPNIPILYEDDHLLVIDKPVNVLSQADRTGDPDVLTLCKGYLSTKSDRKRSVYLGLVQRLDRPVSGVMVLAKTPGAASGLAEQIRSGLVKKIYYAVVHGETPPNGVLIHYLEKDSETNVVKASSQKNKKAKRAELSFVRVAFNSENTLSLLKIHLVTGRPHQIRVQFSAEGFPITGDTKYSSRTTDYQGITLRSSQLIANHPVTKNTLNISTPIPDTSPWSLFSEGIH